MTDDEFVSWLDLFSGGVPTGEFFRGTIEEVKTINRMRPPAGAIDRLAELCFVGALSYFEAFCKDNFASILNIAPELIHRLARANVNINIDSRNLLGASRPVANRIGFGH